MFLHVLCLLYESKQTEGSGYATAATVTQNLATRFFSIIEPGGYGEKRSAETTRTADVRKAAQYQGRPFISCISYRAIFLSADFEP